MTCVHAGALLAPLGSRDLLPAGPLPPVTMVFCSVEGGKQYAAWRRHDAHEVHLQLVSTMQRLVTAKTDW